RLPLPRYRVVGGVERRRQCLARLVRRGACLYRRRARRRQLSRRAARGLRFAGSASDHAAARRVYAARAALMSYTCKRTPGNGSCERDLASDARGRRSPIADVARREAAHLYDAKCLTAKSLAPETGNRTWHRPFHTV